MPCGGLPRCEVIFLSMASIIAGTDFDISVHSVFHLHLHLGAAHAALADGALQGVLDLAGLGDHVAVVLVRHRVAQRRDARLDLGVALGQVLLDLGAGLLELRLDRGERLLGGLLLARAGSDAQAQGGERGSDECLRSCHCSPAVVDRIAYHRSGTMPRVKVPEILIVETVHQPGSLARVLQVIADAGLTIDHLQALRREQGRTLWEITLEMDEEADRSLYGRIDALPVARFVGKSDRVFDRHRGGKIRTESAIPITTQQVLRDIYTPGVARVCLAIHRDPRSPGNTRASATRSRS